MLFFQRIRTGIYETGCLVTEQLIGRKESNLMDLSNRLETAVLAAKEAGKIIRRVYEGDFAVDYKDKEADDPVTLADRESDKKIKQILLEAFPGDGWLSEETLDSDARLAKDWVWIVDPMDGTREFVQHIPEFAVSIGLVQYGEPVLGVILNPVTEELFTAVKDKGAYLNGKPIHVNEISSVQEAKLLVSRTYTKKGKLDWLRAYFENFVPLGSIAYKMAAVAQGRGDSVISFHPQYEWDVCAGDILIREAGGVFLLPDGKPIRYNQKGAHLPAGTIGCPAAVSSELVHFVQAHQDQIG